MQQVLVKKSLESKEQEMAENMDKIIVAGLVVIAMVTAWAVLTPNHLFVG